MQMAYKFSSRFFIWPALGEIKQEITDVAQRPREGCQKAYSGNANLTNIKLVSFRSTKHIKNQKNNEVFIVWDFLA